MGRYFLEVMYDGTAFHGSQQQGTLPTVQRSLNQALSTLLREEMVTFGASRTDEGVHALCNMYHFDYDRTLPPQLLYKLNAILPPALSVIRIYMCGDPGNPVNARFDALSRTYRYRIYQTKNPFYHQRAFYYPFRLDREALHRTAAMLLEYTSFETFSKRNTQTKTYTCYISESRWEEQKDQLHYIVTANRFLRGMVRGLVGTQLLAGRGRATLSGFREIIESGDCKKADFSVAGHGLYLEKISYPQNSLVPLM